MNQNKFENANENENGVDMHQSIDVLTPLKSLIGVTF